MTRKKVKYIMLSVFLGIFAVLYLSITPWQDMSFTDTDDGSSGKTASITYSDGLIEFYDTLQEAVDRAKNGETINLLRNTTENIVCNNCSFTLEMNEFTIDGNNSGQVFKINGGTVILKNGTITKGNATGSLLNYNSGAGLNISRADVTLEKMKVVGNTAAGNGGAISSSKCTLTIVDSTISDNTASSTGGGIYADETLNLTNVTFERNKSTGGGAAMYFERAEEVVLTGCIINDNHGSTVENVNSSIITIDDNSGDGADVQFNNCQITNNSNVQVTVNINYADYPPFLYDPFNITFNNSLISDNDAYFVGGIYVKDGAETQTIDNRIKLNDTVVKHNTASGTESGGRNFVGGVSIDNMPTLTLTVNGGAIYGNTATNDEANDLYLGERATLDVLAANAMSDQFADPNNERDTTDFSKFKWLLPNKTYIKNNEEIKGEQYAENKHGSALMLTAYDMSSMPTVHYNGEYYETLKEAIDEAKLANDPDAVLTLSPGDVENGTLFDTEDVVIDYPITLDIAECSISSEDAVFKVTGDGRLTLRGNGAMNSLIYIQNDSDFTLETDTSHDISIKFSSDNNKVVVGEGFVKCGKLNIELDATRKATLTTPNMSDDDISCVIVQNAGDKLSPDNLNVIYDQNPITHIWPLIEFKTDDNNITAFNPSVKNAIFVSGKGSVSGTGSYEQPLLTVEDAIRSMVSDGIDGDRYIYIVDTVKINGKVVWNGEDKNITVKRFVINNDAEHALNDAERANMVTVNGFLTLTNIKLDGCGTQYINNGSIINVLSGATLTLDSGAVLTNNNLITDLSIDTESGFKSLPKGGNPVNYSGGAIYTVGGTVTIKENSTISNCHALMGGGIFCENGVIEMYGGTIENNTAEGRLDRINADSKTPYYNASGGGIAIMGDGQMKLQGGKIANNEAEIGGGLSLGNYYPTLTSFVPPFTPNSQFSLDMDGGEFCDNKSFDVGGALFIQSSYVAHITGGDFHDNLCRGGNYGGGAIYVNGGKEGIRDGVLWLEHVLIHNNRADNLGGGIAGCDTSGVVINWMDGSEIYGNWAKYDSKADKYLLPCDISSSTDPYQPSQFNGLKDSQTVDYFTQYMMDGTPYHWKFAMDIYPLYFQGDYAPESFLNSRSGKILYTDAEPKTDPYNDDEVQVRIYNNHSLTSGGGIGTNGTIFIGEPYETQEDLKEKEIDTFEVKKQWKDNGNDIVRPSNVEQIRIWALYVNSDGELRSKISNLMYDRGGDDNTFGWRNVSFRTLADTPLADEDLTVVILEEVIYNDGRHVLSVSDEARENYRNAINTAVEEHIKKMPSYSDSPNVEFIWSYDDFSPFASEFDVDDNGNYTITNSLNYGNLTVSKTVTGARSDKGKTFTFTVTLGDTDINGKYGDMDFKNGVATFGLKHGESITAENLPSGIAYTVTEAEADQDGYTTMSDGADSKIPANKTADVKFVNSKPGEDISVNKVWDDDNSKDRPESVTVQLFHEGEPYGEAVVLSEKNGWAYTWHDLLYSDGWTVKETDIPDGYTAKVTNDGNAWVITNTKDNEHSGDNDKNQDTVSEADFIDVSVTKVWEDNNSPDRPSSVTVQLYRDSKAYGEPVVLSVENNWKHTWSDLEVKHNWIVQEKKVPEGYSASVVNEGTEWTITNTKQPTDDTHYPDEDPVKSPDTGVDMAGLGIITLTLSLIAVLGIKSHSKKKN